MGRHRAGASARQLAHDAAPRPSWRRGGAGHRGSDSGGDAGAARGHRTGNAWRAVPRRAAAGFHRAPGGKDLAGVLEHDHPVTEQAPALVGMSTHHPGRVPVGGIRGRTDRLMLTTAARVNGVTMGAARGAVARHGGGAMGRGWVGGVVRPVGTCPRRPLKKTHLHGHQTLRLPVTAVTTTCWLPSRRVFIAGCKSAQTRTRLDRGGYPNRLDTPQNCHRE